MVLPDGRPKRTSLLYSLLLTTVFLTPLFVSLRAQGPDPDPLTLEEPTFRKTQFRRGDTNADGVVNISDPVKLLEYLFQAGAPLRCREAANANGDNQLDISDAVFSLRFLFIDKEVLPSEPGPFECGVDRDGEYLGCAEYPMCPDDFPLISHALSRITFGGNVDLYTSIQTRADLIDYIEEQLDPPEDYDPAVHEPELHSAVEGLNIGFKGWRPLTSNAPVQRLKAMLTTNAARSKWQLLHVLAQFWNNHFHTQLDALRDNVFRRRRLGGGALRPTTLIFNVADTSADGVLTEDEWNSFRSLHPSAIPWNDFRRQLVDGILTQQGFLGRNQIAYWKYRSGPEQFAVAADMERRDYESLRALSFGRFRDLFEASAKTVAMIIYLNNYENTSLNPNENYAREFCELYGLGVDNVYTQRDIEEISRVFTGWTVDWAERAAFAATDKNFQNNPGTPTFRIDRAEPRPLSFPTTENWDDDIYTWVFIFGHHFSERFDNPLASHDWNRKDLFLRQYGGVDSLGNPVSPADELSIPDNFDNQTVAAGLQEFDLVLDRVVSFRDCAKFISTKLIQSFVTDDLALLAKERPMPADIEAHFDSVDGDSSETLDRVEWAEPIPLVLPNGRPPEIFDRLDSNGDDTITKLEYREPDLLLDALDTWREHDGDIKEVVRTILLSDEFLSLKFYRAKVRTPFENVTATIRALEGVQDVPQKILTAEDLLFAGMELFNFPDPTGESELGFDWLHTVGLLERLKFVTRGANPLTTEDIRFVWNPLTFQKQWNLDTPERAVDFFALLINQGDILPEQRSIAIDLYNSAPPLRELSSSVAFLLSLPQFQKQ